jgi:hypoxanthine phosphoribosyltransferase
MTQPDTADRVRVGDILLDADEIAGIVETLGNEISRDYRDRHPILINLLKGGVIFLADLIRKITIPHHIEFMGVSSYENGTRSSGNVRILEDLTRSVEGRDVIVVEDVIDTGTTLAYILNMLQLRNPRSVEVCALLRKMGVPGQTRIPMRYIGREISNVFVVGYGLDYDENYRHLPYIARLERTGADG